MDFVWGEYVEVLNEKTRKWVKAIYLGSFPEQSSEYKYWAVEEKCTYSDCYKQCRKLNDP